MLSIAGLGLTQLAVQEGHPSCLKRAHPVTQQDSMQLTASLAAALRFIGQKAECTLMYLWLAS